MEDAYQTQINIIEKNKVRKKDMVKVEREDKRLEVQIKESISHTNRKPKPFDYKKYKNEIATVSLISLILFITNIICLVIFLPQIVRLEEDKVVLYVLLCSIVAVVMTLVPYLQLAFRMVLDSDFGEKIIGRQRVKSTLLQVDREIELSHHYSDIFIEIEKDMGKANYEYLVKTSQIYSRKALCKLLRLTNDFIATPVIRVMKYKKRKEIINTVSEQIKNVNGALIISYKGRVPKYVTDAIERIGRNLLIIKGNE